MHTTGYDPRQIEDEAQLICFWGYKRDPNLGGKCKGSTIRTYISSVRNVFINNGWPLPPMGRREMPLLWAAVDGSIEDDDDGAKDPVTITMMRGFMRQLSTNKMDDNLLKFVLLFQWETIRRISEVLRNDIFETDQELMGGLRLRMFEFGQHRECLPRKKDTFASLVFTKSKTNRNRRAQTAYVEVVNLHNSSPQPPYI